MDTYRIHGGIELSLLSVAELADLFEVADELHKTDLANRCADELHRRSEQSVTPIHNIPTWLTALLPQALWHQKVSGGGE
jgi:hypothetical protein